MAKAEELTSWKKEILRSVMWLFIFSICCGILAAILTKFAPMVDPPDKDLLDGRMAAGLLSSFIVVAAMVIRLFIFFEKTPTTIPWALMAIFVSRLCFNFMIFLIARLRFVETYIQWAQKYVQHPEKWLTGILLILSVGILARADATLQRSKDKVTEANKRVRRT